jgi:aspartate aminotransferase
MPKISQKAELMPASPIRKLVPYAEAAKKRGTKVYHLNIGQPDIETPEQVWQKMKSLNIKVLEYSNSEGIESYRKGLAAYYQKLNLNIDYQDILITTGGSEALMFAFMTCLNPGDEVIIPEPFYANYNGFACAAGVKVVPIYTDIDQGFALPSIEEFQKVISPKTKAILICNPGNPTGKLYGKEELEALAEVVAKNDLFLFADEVYREFIYDGLSHYSVLNFEKIAQNTIVVDSVSKRYSMCGARIGAMITKNVDVLKAALKFAQARLSPPTFGQIASEAALETPQAYFDAVVDEYIKRRDLFVDGLNEIEGVFCPKPSGAFYAMVKLPVDNSDSFAQWLLEKFSYQNQTVMIAPATGFYAKPETGFKQARIAYVLNETDLSNALQCIKVALKEYPGKI